MINSTNLTLGVSSVLIILSMGCTRPECRDLLYDLQTQVYITPAMKQYRMDDTVKFVLIAPARIENRWTSRIETIKSFDVNYELFFFKIDSVPVQDLRMDNTFDNITIVEKSQDVRTNVFPNSIYFAPTLTGDSAYVSSFAFSFKQPGVYLMELSRFTDENVSFGGENLKDEIILVDACPKERYMLFNEVNDGADNNFPILCETAEIMCTSSNLEDNREEGFDRRGGYVFEVVE